MASVQLSNINMHFDNQQVLHDINLSIASGEFIVVVGPSGCGKSTLLRIVAGLEIPSSGVVTIGKRNVNEVSPAKRDIAMVFQNYALYPHMTVEDNLGFSLDVHNIDNETARERVQHAAQFLQLTDYLERFPKNLSGGQRQRVAIGRALVRNPGVFLFDEPLSNLDAALRLEMRLKIAELNTSLPEATIIYVTHDQVEAMTLADRIVVLSDTGGIEQIGIPDELYLYPANLFVATFIGSPAMNILPATITSTGNTTVVDITKIKGCNVPVCTPQSLQNQRVLLGVRPEHLRLAENDEPGISGHVAHVEKLGEYSLLHIKVETDQPWLIVKLHGTTTISKGQSITVLMDTDNLHLFDSNGKSLRQDLPNPN